MKWHWKSRFLSCHVFNLIYLFDFNNMVYYVSIVVVYALRLENCLAVSSCIWEHGKSWQRFKLRSFRIVPYTQWSQNLFLKFPTISWKYFSDLYWGVLFLVLVLCSRQETIQGCRHMKAGKTAVLLRFWEKKVQRHTKG